MRAILKFVPLSADSHATPLFICCFYKTFTKRDRYPRQQYNKLWLVYFMYLSFMVRWRALVDKKYCNNYCFCSIIARGSMECKKKSWRSSSTKHRDQIILNANNIKGSGLPPVDWVHYEMWHQEAFCWNLLVPDFDYEF